jgi:hypothetical protein
VICVQMGSENHGALIKRFVRYMCDVHRLGRVKRKFVIAENRVARKLGCITELR